MGKEGRHKIDRRDLDGEMRSNHYYGNVLLFINFIELFSRTKPCSEEWGIHHEDDGMFYFRMNIFQTIICVTFYWVEIIFCTHI